MLYHLHETNPDNGLVRDKTDPTASVSIAAEAGRRDQSGWTPQPSILADLEGVVLQLDAGAQRLARDDSDTAAAANLFSTLGSQARQALTETKEFVVAMRTSARGRLLHEELADLAQRTFSGTEIVVHFTQTGIGSRPSADGRGGDPHPRCRHRVGHRPAGTFHLVGILEQAPCGQPT